MEKEAEMAVDKVVFDLFEREHKAELWTYRDVLDKLDEMGIK